MGKLVEIPIIPHSKGYQPVVHWARSHREPVPAPRAEDTHFLGWVHTGVSASETVTLAAMMLKRNRDSH